MTSADQPAEEKTKRRAARDLIGTYHQEQLRALLEHVRDGFAQLDAGEIAEFDVDDPDHRYKRDGQRLVEVLREHRRPVAAGRQHTRLPSGSGRRARLVGQELVAG